MNDIKVQIIHWCTPSGYCRHSCRLNVTDRLRIADRRWPDVPPALSLVLTLAGDRQLLRLACVLGLFQCTDCDFWVITAVKRRPAHNSVGFFYVFMIKFDWLFLLRCLFITCLISKTSTVITSFRDELSYSCLSSTVIPYIITHRIMFSHLFANLCNISVPRSCSFFIFFFKNIFMSWWWVWVCARVKKTPKFFLDFVCLFSNHQNDE